LAPYRLTPDGVTLHIRVTPNAGADRIEGTEIRADGGAVLRLRVAAVPDRGKANAAVIALLARALGLRKSALSLVAGETSRLKTVEIAGNGLDLSHRLDGLIGGQDGLKP
jgi:uncharacterized protein